MAKQIEYTADRVMERGYEIHDEWIRNGYSSRKIVSIAERATASVQAKRTSAACTEALACLFALDIRIKEKYNSLLRCFFSYFSWRRETRAFKHLKEAFNIPNSLEDIRAAIEVELQGLRERIEAEAADDDGDTTRGGKRNGKSEEEIAVSDEKGQEQAPDEGAEQTDRAEESRETAEEKAEEKIEQSPAEKQVKDGGKQQRSEKMSSEKGEPAQAEEKEQIAQENQSESREENKSLDEKSKLNIDKPQDARSYNESIDSPPIYEETAPPKATDTTSFVDEVIMDNMIKGKEDIVAHNPLTEAKQDREVKPTVDLAARQNEEGKVTDKDAYLYDKMVATDKSSNAQKNEKISTVKTEQIKEVAPKDEEIDEIKQDFESVRVPLQVDITLSQENEMRRDINNNMSAEAIKAIYESQANAMREQLNIASAELGIDAPVEIIGRPDAVKNEQPTVAPNRK